MILREPPPKTAIFFNERFMAARHKEGCYLRNASVHFFVGKTLPNNDVEVGQGIAHLRRYGRELVSKPAISLKKCWGGYRSKTHVPS